MKKVMLFIALFCAITGYIYGDSAVDSTRSMSYTHLSAIKTAFSGASEIGEFYWEHFVNYERSQQGIEDSLMAEDGRWLDYFNADLYVKEAIWGAVGLDIPGDETDSLKLDKAKKYLLVPNDPYESYLDLDEVWDYLGAGNDSGTNMWFGFITRNVAIMVDMLWNYVEATERNTMCARLDSLADSLHFHLDRLKNTWGTGVKPQFFQPHFYASALGLAGCVLGDTTYINFAKDLIFDFQVPYTEEPQNGYLDLFTTGEYYIGEGLSYFGSNNLTQLNL